MKILAAWIGTQDLNAATGPEGTQDGPIANALRVGAFDCALLLANQDEQAVKAYVRWLGKRVSTKVDCRQVQLPDPTDFRAIYEIDCAEIDRVNAGTDEIPEWTFHLSPGTPAMASVWTLLSCTKYPATLIQSSIGHGVKTIIFPFQVSAEYTPASLKPADERLIQLSAGLKPETYRDFQFRSTSMTRLLRKAQKAMPRSFPVLIEGEQGTEKELLARAIHSNGPRSDQPFVVFDCAAHDPNLLHQWLFAEPAEGYGHPGEAPAWERADQGTLFIDNIELLSKRSQAFLQRLLDQDQRGDPNIGWLSKIDVRLIAASTAPLLAAVSSGQFLESCFFKLATLVLKLPALRDRQGDLSHLIDRLLHKVNEQSTTEPDFVSKKLSPGAKNVFLQHSWPGNLRELESTIRRAAIVADTATITEADALEALLPMTTYTSVAGDITNRPIESGVDLQEVLAQVTRNYLIRALEIAEGNKSEAARLLGLSSYQTLSNWMKKYEIE